MSFWKGLPPTEPEGDYRGRYGIGRRAHGSDPHAHYEFAAKIDPRAVPPELVVRCAPEPTVSGQQESR